MKRRSPWFVFLCCLLLTVAFIASALVFLGAQRPLIAWQLGQWESWTISTEADLPEEVPPEEFETLTPGSPVHVPVLLYHRVRDPSAKDTYRERLMTVTPASFERQMQSLVDGGFTTITPEELLYALVTSTARLPEKPVLLTFDDGYRDHYTNVLPVLKRLNLQATYYIVPEARRFGGFLTEEMVKEIAASGHVTIGSHTLHHAALTRVGETVREEEIRESKSVLESWTGKPVISFAYPYGFLSSHIEDEVAAAGYGLAFRTGAGASHTSSTRFELRRIQINNDTNVAKTAERYLK